MLYFKTVNICVPATLLSASKNNLLLTLSLHQQADNKSVKPVRGEGGDKQPITEPSQKRKGNKIHLDEAEGEESDPLYMYSRQKKYIKHCKLSLN